MVVFLFCTLLFTKTEIHSTLARSVMGYAGLLLTAVGALGRIWSSMFICGYKKKVIIDTGPYAAVRNPLYVFSFIGLLGIALASLNLLFAVLVIAMFLAYYPLVIISEEQNLKRIHGRIYEAYLQRTPRLVPDFKKLDLPENYGVNAKDFSGAFLDAIWFFAAYVMIDVIAALHANGLIPALLAL